jgi:uncharacterized protein
MLLVEPGGEADALDQLIVVALLGELPSVEREAHLGGSHPPGRRRIVIVVEVRNNPVEHRYEAVVDGAFAGFTSYRLRPGVISFVHTEVDDAFAGHGVASVLIREALEDARRRGLEVLPFCPFVNSFIASHREFVDLVPGSRRQEFGL